MALPLIVGIPAVIGSLIAMEVGNMIYAHNENFGMVDYVSPEYFKPPDELIIPHQTESSSVSRPWTHLNGSSSVVGDPIRPSVVHSSDVGGGGSAMLAQHPLYPRRRYRRGYRY